MSGHLANPTSDTRRGGFKNNGADETVSEAWIGRRVEVAVDRVLLVSREADVEQGHWSESLLGD